MDANRSQFFSKSLTTVTASYKDQEYDLAAMKNHLKVKVAGGDVDINLVTADDTKVDITVKAGEEMDFDNLSFSKLCIKQGAGAISLLRVWAWQ